MTRRREIEQHRKSITEIRNIMNSMKNLAYLETRRLDRFINSQRAVIHSMEEAATDLLDHFPGIITEASYPREIYLLVGSERGFCGDFNQALLHHLADTVASEKDISIIAMGSKLHTLLEGDERVVSSIESASISDEVLPVLSNLTNELVRLRENLQASKLFSISFINENEIKTQNLLPSFRVQENTRPQHAYPPTLNLSPENTLLQLGDHYLFARLNGLIYDSLMAENRRRISHLDSAVHKLDEETDDLKRRGNIMRQEEIIEEIEVILLNASKQDNND